MSENSLQAKMRGTSPMCLSKAEKGTFDCKISVIFDNLFNLHIDFTQTRRARPETIQNINSRANKIAKFSVGLNIWPKI